MDKIAGDSVHRVERVLDVRQGELCWVTGTVYMDMPLKPNILDDISKDVSMMARNKKRQGIDYCPSPELDSRTTPS